MRSKQLKISSPTELHDLRRENLDAISTFHITLMLQLYPDTPPSLLRLSILDLESELIARTIRTRAERERLEKEIATKRARIHQDILPFLTKGPPHG